MSAPDKALLMHKVEDTLKPRMFANLLEEAVEEIQGHLDDFDVTRIAADSIESDDLLQLYLDAKRTAGRTEKTLTRYQYIIERSLRSIGLKTRDITKEHLRQYFADEMARGVSARTVDGVRQVLSGYFDWLSSEQLIPRNPAHNIEAIKYEQKERLALSYVDTDILARSCSTIRDRSILTFLLATGCRVSEVTGLNRDSVNLDLGECVVFGKGQKERMVYLDDVAVLTLREYLASRTDSCDALFVGKGGKRLLPGGVRAMLKRLAASCGVDNVHPHRFRRTLVTRLLNRGMAIQDVAVIAGHTKIDTTMKYYSQSKARIKNSYRMHTA